MNASQRVTAAPLTVAAATLLLAARNHERSLFTRADLDRLLHPQLRYSRSGPGAQSVDSMDAFTELLEAGLIAGDPDSWEIPQ